MPAKLIDNVKYAIIPLTKIADITHPDVNAHNILASALGLPTNTVAIFIRAARMAGTGNFVTSNAAKGMYEAIPHTYSGVWACVDVGSFYYYLTVANDDWDIYSFGYLYGGS